MAECGDVEQVVVSAITQMVYPYGTAAASIAGQPCRIYRGWPIPGNLDSDLKAGKVNITVFPLDAEQNVTRYTTDWQELPNPPITLNLTVAGSAVTITGTPACPLNAAILVNSKVYVYPLQATDTPTSVATALAALISADIAATNIGPVITIPGATKLAARIGRVGSVIQEVKRQKKSFRITVWCNSPLIRDAVANVIDPGLAGMSFVSLPDGTGGRIRYERTHTDDVPEKALLFRRDLIYSVEYGTTISRRAADVVAEQFNIAGGLDPSAPALKSFSI